jgi:hypothetical protein
MIRKPIAASVYVDADGDYPSPVLVVVCDDGSVWERALASNSPRWRKQLPVPNTPAEEEHARDVAAHRASVVPDVGDDEPF